MPRTRVLTSANGMGFEYAIIFKFEATNNETKYEDLRVGVSF